MKKTISESNVYGKLIMLIGTLLLLPIAVVPFFPGELQHISSFAIPSISSVLLGIIICVLAPQKGKPVDEWQSPLQRASLPILCVWFFAFFAGAIPFVMSGQLNFMLSLFESASGWTTTGLTVMDVAAAPRIFLFHRSFMQYCGGLGFVIMIAVLVQSKQNMNLYSAEGHPDRIMPSLKKTARIISLLYGSFLLIGSLIYFLFGMELFDAVCHTMSALSTAGFTTHANSIGTYGSLPIEITTIVLMLIGGTNFAVLLLLAKRKLKKAAQVSEVRFMFGILLVFILLAAASLAAQMNMSFGGGIRNAVFGVVAVSTTSGYYIADYLAWPPFALGLLMILMAIGGSAGSTAGGLKLFRAYIVLRVTAQSVKNKLFPARKVTTLSCNRAQGKVPIDNALVKEIFTFVFCYAGVLIAGTLLLALTSGFSLFDAMFEFTSALSTTGISNGLTSGSLPVGSLLVLMFAMVLGRLEIFIVFIGIFSGIHLLRKKAHR
ncbi:MAG: TrkH family potassium uptake protein [Oscillospiraceae bacterium]|nr:TrkH family potassium uptake protein [Oscillospiraceae bacterium]